MVNKYRNRDGALHTFTLNKDGNVLWEGNFDFHRFSQEEGSEEITMVDPSGGPYLAKGMPMMGGKKISRFELVEGGYLIIPGN